MPAVVRSATSATAERGSAITASRPAGTLTGDLLIAVYLGDSGLSGASAPGWSIIASRDNSVSSNLAAVRVYKRTATTSEPATYSFGQPTFAAGAVHLVCVSGASPDLAVKVAVADSNTDAVIAPNVMPAAASSVEFRVAAWGTLGIDQPTLSPPLGYTSRGSARTPDGVLQTAAASRQVNSSTPTGPQRFAFSLQGTAPGTGVSISIASAETGPQPEPPPPFTPGRGIAPYRYVLRTWGGTYLDDLELVGVSFDKRIGQPGSFSATIPIPSRKVAQRVARVIPRDTSNLGIGPGVITVEIYRGGDPWGEYWITGAQIGRSGRGTPSISLRGSTMDAYLAQVEIQEDLDFLGFDQIDIARGLIDSMQAQPHADLKLVTQTGSSGVTRDFHYAAFDGTYGQRLAELAELDGGFEWTIDIEAGPSGLERHWRYGYPKLGSGQVEHVFVDAPHGGDILEWNEEIDALRGATSWRARGGSDPAGAGDASTDATSLLSGPHEASAHLAAGWPLITRTLSYSSVTDIAALEDYAAYWATAAGGALRVDSVTVALGAEPTFTPNSLGDQARIFLDNEWHLAHSRVRRIIGVGITPISRETGKEEAQLVFEGLEVADGG